MSEQIATAEVTSLDKKFLFEELELLPEEIERTGQTGEEDDHKDEAIRDD